MDNKETSNIILTDKEKQLIADFRSISIQGQEYILEQMQIAKSFYKANRQYIDKYHREERR